jgi:hypothetical protein
MVIALAGTVATCKRAGDKVRPSKYTATRLSAAIALASLDDVVPNRCRRWVEAQLGGIPGLGRNQNPSERQKN